jgi:hypothetical protein
VSEKEFVREMNRIVRESSILEDAIEKARALFVAEVGETRLLVSPIVSNASIFGEKVVREFLESRRFPFRGVYTAPFGEDGVLIACIGSWGAPMETIQSLVDHAAVRLSPLLDGAPTVDGRRREAA